MNKTDLENYKAVLEAKRAELSAGLRNREDIAIEKMPDAMDEIQRAGERDLAIHDLDRGSNLLRSVQGALARMADGSYGYFAMAGTGGNGGSPVAATLYQDKTTAPTATAFVYQLASVTNGAKSDSANLLSVSGGTMVDQMKLITSNASSTDYKTSCTAPPPPSTTSSTGTDSGGG